MNTISLHPPCSSQVKPSVSSWHLCLTSHPTSGRGRSLKQQNGVRYIILGYVCKGVIWGHCTYIFELAHATPRLNPTCGKHKEFGCPPDRALRWPGAEGRHGKGGPDSATSPGSVGIKTLSPEGFRSAYTSGA